jgi:LmbE family N-acetylglucosaminyl deacetylase
LFDCFEARVALAKEFRKYRPNVVIGFGNKTPLASPDHWQAMQITDAALFYARLTKWDDYFDGLPAYIISHQLYFRLAFEPFDAALSPSQFVVDITETLETKLRSVRCYKTQFPLAKQHVFDRIQAAALYTGAMAGFHAGESFSTTRLIGTRDLVKFLLP